MLRKNILLYISIINIVFMFRRNKKEVDPNHITDDLGNVLDLKESPKRVITLAPNLTEMIYYLGVEKYLVGNTLYCNYPPAAQKIEKVGDMLSINFEKILTLKPDLDFYNGRRK